MAIKKIKIKNFKCFKGLFEMELNKGLNILVGNNETGKSTILEAIHIALTGLYGGRNIRNELSQYLFNKDVVDLYINSVNSGSALPPPSIALKYSLMDLLTRSMKATKTLSVILVKA